MKKNSKLIIILLLFILLIIVTANIIYSLFQPVNSQTSEPIKFVIPKGQAISIIGERLTKAGLIKNPLVFRFIVIKDDLDNKIQAGSFDISPSMSISEIAKHLTVGTQDTWITILEGWRAEEIAESLARQDLDNFDKQEFLNLAKESEGMLYPDTYLVPREMSSEKIYNLLLSTFERKVNQGLQSELESSVVFGASPNSKDFNQILIMASLVEREAKTYEQMRRVAGILWNRIDIGMALQVDATLQYVTGYNKIQQTWWSSPTSQDKQLKSLFNTYLNPGLPPKPICNPGLNAIKATLNPLKSDSLYYIHANDGNMYYSSTYESHSANIKKYLR